MKHFAKGSGAYTCVNCGKMTRETGEGESDLRLCLACFTQAGIENEMSDRAHD